MIQFNLLPDIKQEFVKVNRTKRIVTLISILTAGAVFVVFLLLFAFNGLQKKNLSDINKDIASSTKTLKNTPDLDKILTVQNQLLSLPVMQDKVPMTSRVPVYLAQVTPTNVTISNTSVDVALNKLTITGNAPGLDVINTYVDTLKFTTYTAVDSKTKVSVAGKKAFSNVVLIAFGRTTTDASYTIDLNFVPDLFSNTKEVTLTVPSIITTRSQIDQPTDIFQKSPTTNTTGTQ